MGVGTVEFEDKRICTRSSNIFQQNTYELQRELGNCVVGKLDTALAR